MIILQNALLIDGNGGDPLPDATVVIEAQTIKDISDRNPSPGNGDTQVIDLKGNTLMPGLIDAHVHPGNVEWRLTETAELPPAVYVHRVSHTLDKDLQLGFTTLRDAAGLDAGFRTAIDQELIRGPRLFLSVTPLTQWMLEDAAAHAAARRASARNSLGIYPELCHGPEEIRQATRRTLGRGANQIKIFADGEVVSQSKYDQAGPGSCKFSVEELHAAVETANESGSYVMAHTYSPTAIQNCIAAGVRSIEHGNLLDERTARMMAKAGVYYVPTLTTYDVLAQYGKDVFDDNTLDKLAMVGHHGFDALEIAYRQHVKIASGSDIIGPLQHLKGRELALKAEVMTPMGAIVSATRTNAELIGHSDRLGTVEPGKLADLIVVDGNPLDDMSVFEIGLQRTLLVMKGGRIFKNLL